jgi:ribosome-binding factor A
MTDAARARKLADRIREVVAEKVERGIKDPRLGFVTITDVRLTGDLREATVFYTVLGDEAARADTAAALASATGVLRAEVGRQCRVRHVPSLAFREDDVQETSRALDEVIERVRLEDAEKAAAAVAAGAQPVAGVDVYRDLDPS